MNAYVLSRLPRAKRPLVDTDDTEDGDDEARRTIFCPNLGDNITEEVLYELFLQGGPIQSVRIVRDRTGKQNTYGFVTFRFACAVPYALRLYEGIRQCERKTKKKNKKMDDHKIKTLRF